MNGGQWPGSRADLISVANLYLLQNPEYFLRKIKKRPETLSSPGRSEQPSLELLKTNLLASRSV
jgi:hypothetical protein